MVLVTGPTADSQISLNNGWTWVWQGSEPSLYPAGKLTIQQAVKAKVGERNFKFRQGTKLVRGPGPANTTPTMVDQEVDIKEADVVSHLTPEQRDRRNDLKRQLDEARRNRPKPPAELVVCCLPSGGRF